MRKNFWIYIMASLWFTGSIMAENQDTTEENQTVVEDIILPVIPVEEMVKDTILDIPIVPIVPVASTFQLPDYFIPKYKTDWRCYLNVYGTTYAFPSQLDIHILKFILAYKFVGIGTTVCRVYAKDLFTDDFAEDHKLVVSYAPAYLYLIPFASSRQSGDVTPLASYFFIGGSNWGQKEGKFFDVGIGASVYVWDFVVGYNAISASSRNPFVDENMDFNDYPVSWGNFYFSITLSTGHWISAGAKLLQSYEKANVQNE